MDRETDSEFRADDYFDVIERHFSDGGNYFRPASADNDLVIVPKTLAQSGIVARDLASYNNDDAGLGPNARLALVDVLRGLGETGQSMEGITLAPSITSASLNVIFWLISQGFRHVSLETPCYYGTLFQLRQVGLRVSLLPTYFEENYSIPPSARESPGTVYWMTQPRISLAIDQEIETLLDICRSLERNRSLLVMDEATELKRLALLSRPEFDPYRPFIIRLRSLFKPLAINGQRLAYIQHSDAISGSLKRLVWISHGGLGRHSIETVFWVQRNIKEYLGLREIVLSQCRAQAKSIATALLASSVAMPKYENGYTTSLSFPLAVLSGKGGPLAQPRARERLLEILKSLRVLPTLGASMYFANRDDREQIRLNLLAKREPLLSFCYDLSTHFRNLKKTS